ncbi:30S ribosomal protein S18 [candidate division WOR-3 bacterium]|nr:30S ribosomal protein S18 [candidate division WOR-3 bacterium]
MKKSKKKEKNSRSKRFKKPISRVRKACFFCTNDVSIDYKKPEFLRKYISDSGKILPRRTTNICAKHQRALTRAIKHARVMALLPFTRIY